MSAKVVVALLLVASVSCYVAALKCDALLHCKECYDEVHCLSCPEGYTLDSNKVCRFDCAAKFSTSCPSCTEEKCICPLGEEWDSENLKCVQTACDKEDTACKACGKGANLISINGKCSTCEEAFGEGCATCSWAKCLSVKTGYKPCGAVVVSENATCPETCGERFPGCATCTQDGSACQACADGAELEDSACKIKASCPTVQTPVIEEGKIVCHACTDFDGYCLPGYCTANGCTRCRNGFHATAEGKCAMCNKTYPGCAMCDGNQCTRCGSSMWALTPMGCIDQNIYVPPSDSNGGMVAGIVIGVLVLVVLIVIAIYCIITSTAKKGGVDPSLYEDDFEFKSMSVL